MATHNHDASRDIDYREENEETMRNITIASQKKKMKFKNKPNKRGVRIQTETGEGIVLTED